MGTHVQIKDRHLSKFMSPPQCRIRPCGGAFQNGFLGDGFRFDMQESVALQVEDPPRFVLVDPALLVDVLQQSASLDIFHDNGQVRRRIEYLRKAGGPCQVCSNMSGVYASAADLNI